MTARPLHGAAGPETDPLIGFRPWFYAAAVYNLLWGSFIILFPRAMFGWMGMAPPAYLPLWQVVGMLILVYAPAYWWVARRPSEHRHLVVIGLLGKVLGPIGFVWSAMRGDLPVIFGMTIVTNDLIWWPAFVLYLRAAARRYGGWRALLSGE